LGESWSGGNPRPPTRPRPRARPTTTITRSAARKRALWPLWEPSALFLQNDLRDAFDRPLDPRHGELWHLRESGLVQTVRLDRDTTVVTLTKEGVTERSNAATEERLKSGHAVGGVSIV
jgi:hypothetical protein